MARVRHPGVDSGEIVAPGLDNGRIEYSRFPHRIIRDCKFLDGELVSAALRRHHALPRVAAARRHHAREDIASLREPPVCDKNAEIRRKPRKAVLLHAVLLHIGEILRQVRIRICTDRGLHEVEVFTLRDAFLRLRT